MTSTFLLRIKPPTFKEQKGSCKWSEAKSYTIEAIIRLKDFRTELAGDFK